MIVWKHLSAIRVSSGIMTRKPPTIPLAERAHRLFAKARTQQLQTARRGDLRASMQWASRAQRVKRAASQPI